MSARTYLRLSAWLLAIAGVLLVAGSAGADWLPGWGYRQEIAVGPTVTPANLSDFPLLVQITDSANPVFSSAASSNGLDIVFTAADGVTLLPREIEHFSAGATKEMDAWVKTNLSPSTPTKLYMYYRGFEVPNAQATWDANFKMVQHLQESPANSVAGHIDSTSNANTGTPYNFNGVPGSTTNGTGRINGANEFDGSNDYVDCGKDGSLSITNALTVEQWVKLDTVSPMYQVFVGKVKESSDRSYETVAKYAKAFVRVNPSTTCITTNDFFTPGTWAQFTYTFSDLDDSVKIYKNGALFEQWTTTETMPTSTGKVAIGTWGEQLKYFTNGALDEVRISDVARDPNWIKASYNNQSDPAAHQAVDRQTTGPWLDGWRHRQAIRISKDATDADLTDFAALVKITDPNNQVFARAASPDGHDVVFTAADGTTLLSHELEHFSAGATKELDAWVNTPLSASEDTVIYMYYDGPFSGDPSTTATWDANYKMVQHLQESSASAGSRKDSTTNANDGNPLRGSTPMDLHTTAGQVDGADVFNGSSDHINLGDNGSLDVGTGTWEAWVRPTSFSDHAYHTVMAKDYNTGWWFGLFQNDGRIQLWTSGTAHQSTGAIPLGVWSHIVATWDGSEIKYYINGVYDSSSTETGGPATNNYDAHIGIDYANHPTDYEFTGIIDEIRISDIARSGDWIMAGWRLMNDPGTYLTVGPQMSVPEPASVVLLALAGLLLAGHLRHRISGGKRS